MATTTNTSSRTLRRETTMRATTSSLILRHAATYLSSALSCSDLRLRLLSSARRNTHSNQQTSQTLHLASETLETAISTTTNGAFRPTTISSSLHLAESLLLPFPPNSLSTLLLSLIYALFDRPLPAASLLLDLFVLDPALARSELAPSLFEDLFLFHLLPALQSFQDRRSRILDCVVGDENLGGFDFGVLSRMSGKQAMALRRLERDYEKVLDENCRAFAKYFKEILEHEEGDLVLLPPEVVVLSQDLESDERVWSTDKKAKERKRMKEKEFRGGRYNVMEVVCFCPNSFPTSDLFPSFDFHIVLKLIHELRLN